MEPTAKTTLMRTRPNTVVDTSFRVDETKDELPVTSIGIAVAPLRINASLSLIGLINDLSEAFDVVAAASYDFFKALQ